MRIHLEGLLLEYDCVTTVHVIKHLRLKGWSSSAVHIIAGGLIVFHKADLQLLLETANRQTVLF